MYLMVVGAGATAYPTQGTASGTAGIRFNVPTTGFAGITIQFDHRASGTASRWAQLEYSLDGGNAWIVLGNNAGGLSPQDVFYSFIFDLSAITRIDNHPDFTFRIVSIFSPLAFDQNAGLDDYAANTAYMRAISVASYTAGAGIGTGN
ncbi:MAG: hypothetical protein FJ385_04125 [Verrucomicrobia bacterium]|nr:hypothetical protein [Verrucomicrobiota bacterium]